MNRLNGTRETDENWEMVRGLPRRQAESRAVSWEREESSLDCCAKGKGSAGVVTEATCGFWVFWSGVFWVLFFCLFSFLKF